MGCHDYAFGVATGVTTHALGEAQALTYFLYGTNAAVWMWWRSSVTRKGVAGGGARNGTLLAALRRALPVPVHGSGRAGVDPDAREALVFAALAARCLAGEGVTRPETTGAAGGRVLGKISPAFGPGER